MSSFLSSQRYLKENEWVIEDDKYHRFTFRDGSYIFIGDIVATGSTLKNGLEAVYKYCEDKGVSPRGLVLFTIGSDKAEDVLEEYHKLFSSLSKTYEKTIVVYTEGIFKTADENTTFRIKVPGTDLIRQDCLVTPEFEVSQYNSLAYPMERCVVYDGSSRSFEVEKHIKDVLEYWKEQRAWARNGLSLWDAYNERWNLILDHEKYVDKKKDCWDVPIHKINHCHEKMISQWSKTLQNMAREEDSLVRFCSNRISTLEQLQ